MIAYIDINDNIAILLYLLMNLNYCENYAPLYMECDNTNILTLTHSLSLTCLLSFSHSLAFTGLLVAFGVLIKRTVKSHISNNESVMYELFSSIILSNPDCMYQSWCICMHIYTSRVQMCARAAECISLCDNIMICWWVVALMWGYE